MVVLMIYQNQLAALKKQRDELKESMEFFKNELNHKNVSLMDTQDELKSAREEIEKLKGCKTAGELWDRCNATDAENAKLKAEKERLENLLRLHDNNLVEYIQERIHQVDSKKVEGLKVAIGQIDLEWCDLLKKKVKELEATKTATLITDEITNLRKEIEVLKKSLVGSAADMVNLKKDMKARGERLEVVEKERDELIKQKDASMKTIMEVNESLIRQKGELIIKINERDAELGNLKVTESALEKITERQEKEIEKKDAEIQALEEQRKAMIGAVEDEIRCKKNALKSEEDEEESNRLSASIETLEDVRDNILKGGLDDG
jgi:chromosome segregation ATPase